MTYAYNCVSCECQWEARLPMDSRDQPLDEACPHCNLIGNVRRVVSAPGISYDGNKTILQRAGSGWNDVLNKVKKASGRNTTIQTR